MVCRAGTQQRPYSSLPCTHTSACLKGHCVVQGGHPADALIGRPTTLALVGAPQQPLADHLSDRALLTAAHAAHCLHCCHAALQTCTLECNAGRVVSPPGSQLESTCTVVNGTGVWSQPTSSCAASKLAQASGSESALPYG